LPELANYFERWAGCFWEKPDLKRFLISAPCAVKCGKVNIRIMASESRSDRLKDVIIILIFIDLKIYALLTYNAGELYFDYRSI